jgi:hypothetical protein
VKTILVLVAVLVIPAAAYAQQTASIVGTVRDASGAVIPGVTVEASSPVLIEKARSAVTNTTGQYSIDELRPGIYTVTFTLSGFNTYKREGIELTGSFIATVNADMKVGGVSETITVSGEAPVVDVTSSKSQETINGETVANLPTSHQYGSLVALVPAINVQGGNEVGGAGGNIFNVFQIHGGRRNEGQVLVDGMSAGYQGMGVSSYVTEIGNAQEVNFSLAGGLGEATTGGPQLNIVGKQGGNMFAGSFFITGTGSAFQGNNIDAALKAKGFQQANSVAKSWDINPSGGGPIVKDKLWFFATYRYQANDQNVANMFVNLNAGNNNAWTYLPADGKDGRPLEQAVDDGRWKNGSIRLTWQPNAKNKVSYWTDVQYICQHCIQGGDSSGLTFGGMISSPEALQRVENRPNQMTQIAWSSPVTSRLLLEGNAQIGPYFWWGGSQKNSYDPVTIPVQDDGGNGSIPGINYRSSNWSDHTGFTNIFQGSASYVTGAHSAKFGVRYHANDSTFPKNFYNNYQLKYNFNNGVPYQLTMYADQGSDQHQHQGIFAMYAQDRWTLGRLTLQGGLRFEHLRDSFAQQQMGPNRFLPQALIFPATDGPLNHKDLQPRFGASYDVFGNGKTAAKFFIGEYVTTVNTVDEWLHYSPAGAQKFISSVTRNWNPSLPVGDPNYFTPQCDLLNQAANGDCGPGNPFFGQTVALPYQIDPAATTGWNTREHSWDLMLGVTQQLAPRVSLEVAFNHRSWGNLTTTINRDLTPADFNPFIVNVPNDPKLPGGGGYPLTFYEITPAKYNQYNNLLTLADNAGGITNTYKGVDINVNARFQSVVLQGGISTGNVIEDDCGVVHQHPETYISAYLGGGTLDAFSQFFPVGIPGQWPQAFCHRESGWTTNIKGLATYTVPKIDVLLSGTLHSVPFAGSNFPAVTSQSLSGLSGLLFFQTSLGRPFSGVNPLEFFNIVKPGALYGDRITGIDLRIGKNLRYGRTRTLIALDIFNLANSNAADVYQLSYGVVAANPAFLNPLSVTQARLFKISAQFDF